jgi:hypothetical protein
MKSVYLASPYGVFEATTGAALLPLVAALEGLADPGKALAAWAAI